MNKQFYKSKRFYTGLAALITGIGIIVTGEQNLTDALPEVIVTVLGLVQLILGVTSTNNIAVGSTIIGRK